MDRDDDDDDVDVEVEVEVEEAASDPSGAAPRAPAAAAAEEGSVVEVLIPLSKKGNRLNGMKKRESEPICDRRRECR